VNSLEIFNKHKETKPSIVTIGTFDGIHEGHTSLLTNMINHKNKLTPIVISFNKSPKDIINKKKSKMIFELNEKKKIIQEIGIEKIIDIDFNLEIQGLTCRDFIKILKHSLNMEILILGEDTLLGKDRKGYQNGLIEILNDFDSKLIPVSNKKDIKSKISSSQIKKSISDGDIERANLLLGRKFFLNGRVIEGEKVGASLGYPTANIQYNNDLVIPKDGVYKTETYVNGKTYLSATSIGNNPTFNGSEKTIETFIIDFEEDIYNKNIKVSFLEFIRDQIKFNDVKSLKKRMSDDINYIVNGKG
tara:strand:+ start:2540 stop:3448 length:909 start_codon:yes stop_codon:yes gene_type:complete